MTCFSSPGTGMPQEKVVRLMERSFKPWRTKERISFRRLSGCMNSGWASMCSRSRSW